MNRRTRKLVNRWEAGDLTVWEGLLWRVQLAEQEGEKWAPAVIESMDMVTCPCCENELFCESCECFTCDMCLASGKLPRVVARPIRLGRTEEGRRVLEMEQAERAGQLAMFAP
jgi:hypothetical protein